MTRCFCYLVGVTLPHHRNHTRRCSMACQSNLVGSQRNFTTKPCCCSQSVSTSLFEKAAPVFSSQMRPGRWAALHSEGNLCCSLTGGLNLSSFGGVHCPSCPCHHPKGILNNKQGSHCPAHVHKNKCNRVDLRRCMLWPITSACRRTLCCPSG